MILNSFLIANNPSWFIIQLFFENSKGCRWLLAYYLLFSHCIKCIRFHNRDRQQQGSTLKGLHAYSLRVRLPPTLVCIASPSFTAPHIVANSLAVKVKADGRALANSSLAGATIGITIMCHRPPVKLHTALPFVMILMVPWAPKKNILAKLKELNLGYIGYRSFESSVLFLFILISRIRRWWWYSTWVYDGLMFIIHISSF